MDPTEVFEWIPFARELGIEIAEAADGHARGHLSLEDWHSSNPQGMIAHGGVAYSLADTVGGAAAVSANGRITPTIDMRIDYLTPATGEELHAEADVVRNGNSVATVDVVVTDETDTHIAEARGVYKTGGGDDETPWTTGVDRSEAGLDGSERAE
ncbi:PaaI family thioesterase [Salinirubellus salinus]|jgi:uncharacterized protein (TIGR00369 family)|uniref:PaaI family thioesterase n=1 Tax=Salinirubellus salinus TaxID=1364945 RepID=A0A9E7R5Q2_9EURY|nr:PaaI family thioesterase [Salinirubellus salinus]UWM55946.1 PaaI family thioesterase [Salinirubellus salinus]